MFQVKIFEEDLDADWKFEKSLLIGNVIKGGEKMGILGAGRMVKTVSSEQILDSNLLSQTLNFMQVIYFSSVLVSPY